MRFEAVHKAIDEGHTEIVDADLSKYFDTIPARRADHVRGTPHQRWEDAASDKDVAEGAGRRDRRAGASTDEWREEGDPRNTAGRGGFATHGEHLHASVHQGVSQVRSGPPVRRGAGDLRRRFRGPLSARGRGGARRRLGDG